MVCQNPRHRKAVAHDRPHFHNMSSNGLMIAHGIQGCMLWFSGRDACVRAVHVSDVWQKAPSP